MTRARDLADSADKDIAGTLTLDDLTVGGTAYVTGDLTVDTDTLYVDTTNNSIGIGTSSPSRKMHVNGSARFDMAAGTVRISEQSSKVSVQATNSAESAFADLKLDGSSLLLNSQSVGNVGIGTTSPQSKLQIGSHTFTGSNGVYNPGRAGIINNGNLTSIVNASTYNDSSYPEYGLVFIQGPSTSNYNVWSLSPDGPAKGKGLNFIYGDTVSNIHVESPKVTFHGEGYVTMPYQPSFAARGTSSGTSFSGNITLPFNTVDYNIGNHYNNSTYTFTAPVAGIYYFSLSYLNYPSGTTDYVSLWLSKNGSTYTASIPMSRKTVSSQETLQCSGTVSLSANDTIAPKVQLASGSGSHYLNSGHAHFGGYLIG